MNAILIGNKKEEVEALVRKSGITLVTHEPDIVICYGGDGTLLGAEHSYPGIPKVVLKGSRVCKLCAPYENEEVLRRVTTEKYATEHIWKLEARSRDSVLWGVNDIIVHNKDPRHAIRYAVTVDGTPLGGEIIGDGVVFATPFGSTGYYRSITDSVFEAGMGLAFNNSTEQSDHVVLREDRTVTIRIVRGPAVVYADNQEEFVTLEVGDEVKVVKSEKVAKIVRV